MVPAGAALLPMLLIFALIEAVRYAEGLRRTRSPFNRDFLRPAGFSLQRRLEELQLELALSFGFGAVLLIGAALYLGAAAIRPTARPSPA